MVMKDWKKSLFSRNFDPQNNKVVVQELKESSKELFKENKGLKKLCFQNEDSFDIKYLRYW